jgi:hypothetical protein
VLPGDPADPDMCVHLWPCLDPGAVAALGDGLAAAGVAVVAVDELCAFVEEVEAWPTSMGIPTRLGPTPGTPR